MTHTWNYDKPHRCPECHAIWVYGDKYSQNGGWRKAPRWWKTYDCYHCGAVFSGRWAWAEKWRDKARGKANYWRREWRMRRGK